MCVSRISFYDLIQKPKIVYKSITFSKEENGGLKSSPLARVLNSPSGACVLFRKCAIILFSFFLVAHFSGPLRGYVVHESIYYNIRLTNTAQTYFRVPDVGTIVKGIIYPSLLRSLRNITILYTHIPIDENQPLGSASSHCGFVTVGRHFARH